MNLNKEEVLKIIDNALEEDLWTGDITTEAIIDKSRQITGTFLAKESGVIAGLEVVKMVFKKVDSKLNFKFLIDEGTKVEAGEEIAEISGVASSILTGERLALNFLQRMSGIATKTAKYKKLVTDYDVRIVDTRKTTPGLRILEKYAVRIGGGSNHRLGLYDAVMIKDNHIRAVGGIKEAVKRAKANIPHTMTVEVETEDLADVKEALEARADIIMLDNMSSKMMKEAVELIDGEAIVEASGGITNETIAEVAATGVDVISLGTLTHTINSLDISLNFEV
ncbi:carboxylating nicotinate-nucleotide diphosphorylase [Selenihalanaerobacter shriftii]|uniref:Probable nicotinate-nucleotide pyrophosphorylase [carboxylating] n=1 Tax=Selenihalanaerobacter shriftii TaxID=142842 RepID=A0A1T4LCB8_9FIRM|nr:carboxylating nicotinate-nucleotide diphosphorylase [Selenihalanaerobacter shriftii]SJZ52340.1 nicotinate-nucleotide pyrophosphorylase [carboxylating] [Selenihalanaerobacter shriftii]